MKTLCKLLTPVFCLTVLSVSTPSRATSGDESMINLRAGSGVTFEPSTLAFYGAAEYRVDPHFSLGPIMQYGVSAETDFLTFVMSGRLIIPASFWKKMGAPLETSLFGGIGFSRREIQGFNLNDFVFQSGVNIDVLLGHMFTLGLMGAVNMFDNSVERFIPALYVSLGLQF